MPTRSEHGDVDRTCRDRSPPEARLTDSDGSLRLCGSTRTGHDGARAERRQRERTPPPPV